MFYLKRFIFTMIFLFLFIGYAAQNTKQQLIFQTIENKLTLNKSDIEKIQLQPQDNRQTPAIALQLTAAAAKKLQDFSSKNIGQHMQIVWNDITLSDVVIQTALPGKLLITLDVDSTVAQEMVSNLR